jgi:malonyl-CoA O-methyltransferase
LNRIADRFGRAAATYESATAIQHEVAGRLAERVLQAAPPTGGRVAEFGCGTGYLARALASPLQPALWLATDLAPAMVTAARRNLPEAAVAVMDAARPALAPGFDLVCSSLTLQWLDDPVAALARWRALVRPGGLLAVSTLVDGSFAEWRAALAQAGATGIGPAFPTEDAARGWFGGAVEIVTLTQTHADGMAFLRSARASGVDASANRALPAGVMRKALRAFDARGAALTYKVALAVQRL